jgi:hypothetical protein
VIQRILILAGFALLLCWAIRNFLKGKAVTSGLTFLRRDNPILFWIYSIFFIGLLTIIPVLIGYIWWKEWF